MNFPLPLKLDYLWTEAKKKKNAVPLCSHEQKSFWTLLPLKLYNAFPTKTMKQYQAQQIVGFKEIHGGQWHNDF